MGFIDRLKKNIKDYDSEMLEDKDTFNKDSKTWAHTGCPELEYNLGVLGFPVGITELAGKSKSGKSTLGITGMKNFLLSDENAIAILLLSEERIQKTYLVKIGLPMDRVIIIRGRFVEDIFYKAQIRINDIDEAWHAEKLPGKPKIFMMLDSVGACNSRAELETFNANVEIHKKNLENGTKAKLKHAQMADFARAAKMCMKAIMAQLYEKDIILVLINHLIADINNPHGGSKSGGGGWIEYMPCLRLVLSRKEWIKLKIDNEDQEIGQITIVKVEKNDFGSRRKTEIEILLGYGITLSDADIQYAVDKKLLKKEGESGFSYLNGKLKWNSPRSFYDIYQTPAKKKFMDILSKQITTARHTEILSSKEEDEE